MTDEYYENATVNKRVDVQRQKNLHRIFLTAGQAQPLIDDLSEIFDVEHPLVRATCRIPTRGFYYSKDIDPSGKATIRLAKTTTAQIAVHEFAHHLVEEKLGPGIRIHGEDFARYLDKASEAIYDYALLSSAV